jgi:hypothetical protein
MVTAFHKRFRSRAESQFQAGARCPKNAIQRERSPGTGRIGRFKTGVAVVLLSFVALTRILGGHPFQLENFVCRSDWRIIQK